MMRSRSTGRPIVGLSIAATLAASTAIFAQQPPARPAGPPQSGDRLSRLAPLPFPEAPAELASLDGPVHNALQQEGIPD